jgi:hypothetical protein
VRPAAGSTAAFHADRHGALGRYVDIVLGDTIVHDGYGPGTGGGVGAGSFCFHVFLGLHG